MTFALKSKLPRLPREWYAGSANVFWTHTIEHRVTGWLTDDFHRQFREILIHASSRYRLVCPIYLLMPDHWHQVWMGISPNSDQSLATSFLRKHLSPKLCHARLQDRPHDHVLRGEECRRDAFMEVCQYVKENPVRGGIVLDWKDWPFAGAIVPGYPDFDPRRDDFWDDFWKIYNRLVS